MFTRKAFSLLGIVLFFATTAIPQTSSQSSREETLPSGAAKDTAESACLGCHEARIIVQQRLSKAAWTKEVDKMTKWGAPVESKDRDGLINYLSVNFGPDLPPYQAPRSTPATAKK
jgi:hypothetical protein